jgi:hypothetical protein
MNTIAKKVTSVKTRSSVGKEFSFRSRLENWAEGMDYCAVPVPAAVTKQLGSTAAVLVRARINKSEEFEVSLFPPGSGKHYIRVRKKVRVAANLTAGNAVVVKFVVLDREANAEIPDDLEKALRAENMLKSFTDIPPGARNYIIRRINEAAKPATRKKRIDEAIEAAHEKSEKSVKA